MTHSKSLRAYEDAREIFEHAHANGGARIKCASAGMAVNLRSRLNHFRALDRKSTAEIYPVGDTRHGTSVYDPFVVRLVENTLIIEPRQVEYTIEPLHPEADPA